MHIYDYEYEYEQRRDDLHTDTPEPTVAYIRPQYSSLGLDTGLWHLFNANDELVCENIWLGKRNGNIVVGQFKGWDNESYTEDGEFEDAEYVEYGELTWCNPFDYAEDTGMILDLIIHRANTIDDVEFVF